MTNHRPLTPHVMPRYTHKMAIAVTSLHTMYTGLVTDGQTKRLKGCPYSIAERWVPELIPVLGSQPAGDVRHKPGGRLPLYFPTGLQLPSQPLRGLLRISLLGEQRHDGCEQFA